MSLELLIIYGAVSFVAALMSGVSGGGGGFITTPMLILLGLTPAQAVSSGKFAGLSVAIGSLSGLRAVNSRKLWRGAFPIILLALGIGALVPFAIVNLDADVYKRILGVILLLMIPVLIIRKVGFREQPTSKLKTSIGTALLVVALWLQGVFSGGMGTLVNIILMGMMGMTPLEANITKRYSQLVLNTTVVLGVLWTGLIVWSVAAVAVCASLLGSYLGARLAVKKGNRFVMITFMVAMFVSGVALLLE
jgi:uncharacterized membrane protein YfcA